MARTSLLGGAYSSASLIAAAQKSVNLYPEAVPEKTREGVQAVNRLRAGRRLLSTCPNPGRGRCLYRATTPSNPALTNICDLYAVVDTGVYWIDQNYKWTLLGNLQAPGSTPCYMVDNGQELMLVDGSPTGYSINLTTRVFTIIGDPNFLGADMVDVMDTFIVFNIVNTGNWGATLSNQISFNALDFGSITAFPGIIRSLAIVEREVWLFTDLAGEVWYNAGLQGFTFQEAPSVVIHHGTCAKYSIAKNDSQVYWLSQSPQGARMLMSNNGRAAKRISNFAIEDEWKKYAYVGDAIGGCYQIDGHNFYAIHFPTMDKTWVYDEALGDPGVAWHEENYLDVNGVLRRMRDCFYAFAYDTSMSLDYSNGSLYAIDIQTYVDQISPTQSQPIPWLRRLPHMVGDKFQRTVWDWLIADIEVGNDPGTIPGASGSGFSSGFSSGFGGSGSVAINPLVSLRMSDDRGRSWGNYMTQTMGLVGQYDTAVTWWNLGQSRDKVFELSGASNQRFSLLGVFTDAVEGET
jgi:hypothetical protein